MIISIIAIIFVYLNGCDAQLSDSCGIDKLPATVVYEGIADIHTYPWMGQLIYPFGIRHEETLRTSAIVLITTQLALATALEIDKYPKFDFRKNSRVILGHNCSGPYIRVVEYVYHPDFNRNYHSALAIVQLEVTAGQEYTPICAPPTDFENPHIFGMTIDHECKGPMIRLYKMKYVALNQCRDYYRRHDLDIQNMWPRHAACAQSLHGGECFWRSGTVLVSKQYGRWRLLGVGIYGPECEAPMRFLEYDMYHKWVKKSLARIGKVAVTRMASDHLIIRRSASKIQRFGVCDPEEMQHELYADHTEVWPERLFEANSAAVAKYNITILSKTEYSCIIVRTQYANENQTRKATLKLRRWCHSKTPVCYETDYTTIFFYVEIHFQHELIYKINVYGKDFKTVDVKKVMLWINRKKKYPYINKNLEEFDPYRQ